MNLSSHKRGKNKDKEDNERVEIFKITEILVVSWLVKDFSIKWKKGYNFYWTELKGKFRNSGPAFKSRT